MANSRKIAKFLIDSCADVTTMDNKGRFPIEMAVDIDMLVFLAKEMTAQGYEETARLYMEKWGLVAPRSDEDDDEPVSPVSFYEDTNSSDDTDSK
jgi:hypothetical protein